MRDLALDLPSATWAFKTIRLDFYFLFYTGFKSKLQVYARRTLSLVFVYGSFTKAG